MSDDLMDRVAKYWDKAGTEVPPAVKVEEYNDKSFYDEVKENYPDVSFEDFLAILSITEGTTLVRAGTTFIEIYKKYRDNPPDHLRSAIHQYIKRRNGFELMKKIRDEKFDTAADLLDISNKIAYKTADELEDILSDNSVDYNDRMKALQTASKIINDRIAIVQRDKELQAKKEIGSGNVSIYQGDPPDCDLEVLNEDGKKEVKEVKKKPTIVVFNGSN